MKSILEKIENIFVAASFAEANAHAVAQDYLGQKVSAGGTNQQLQDFLRDIGLQNVPVTYGIARL
jgi:hypothetical protein